MTEAPTPALIPMTSRPRLLSLDVFRGLNIIAMILVNMTWDRALLPEQMFHIGWNAGEQGASFTDLVFPWFIFIAGVAIPFSMSSGRGRSLSALQRILAATRRAMIIYCLGLVLDAASSGQFRFFKWNILQMIAGAYLLGTCLVLLPLWAQAAFVGIVLAAKWYILSVMPHPEHGVSVWYFAVDGAIVDNRSAPGAIPVNGEQVFKSKLLATRSWFPLSDSVNYGPLLNWLCNGFNLMPAAAVCLLGAWVGRYIRSDTARSPRVGWMLLTAGCAAWGLSWLWNLQHPWSKDFFTASYAVLAAGTGAALLGLLYLTLDTEPRLRARVLLLIGMAGLCAAVPAVIADAPPWLQNWSCGAGAAGLVFWLVQTRPSALGFVRAFGLNAIAVYFVNEMLFKMVFTKWSLPVLDPDNTIIGTLYSWLRADRLDGTQVDTALGSWLFAAVWIAGCWLFARWLDRRSWYIRV